MSELLCPKELAAALRRSRTYVHAMKASGFSMPGGTATLEEARDWLRMNPRFSCTAYAEGKVPSIPEPQSVEVDFSS